MKFSYNWLKELSGTKLAPEKLAEILTLASFEVKEVKKEGKDFMMDIDVLPNRASDCFSHSGIAREIMAITNSKGKNFGESRKFLRQRRLSQKPKLQLKNQNRKASDLVSVKVEGKEDCPRYTAMAVLGLEIGESPEWVKQRLNVCGIQSINNVVDITNYAMLETGQPLHVFDLDKLSGLAGKKTIIVRRARKGEKMPALDEKTYDLTKDILVIADAKAPLALAGIKGGKKAEIDGKTKNIVLESANFNRQNIYRTSKKIGLRTDASLRFGSGMDPNLTEAAALRAVNLIQEIAGGQIAEGMIDVYSKKNLPKKINKFVSSAYAAKIQLDFNYVEKLLGVKIPAAKITGILKSLNFEILNQKQKKHIIVKVPTSRLDISLPEDLIEEIGRVYGYEKIPAVLPQILLAPAKRNEIIFWEDVIKDILKSAGFTEIYNYSFIAEKEAETFGYKKEELLYLENPMSAEQSCLRPSLMPGLVKNIAMNSHNFRETAVFEIGKVFRAPNFEQKMISGIMTGDKFYETKGIIDSLLHGTGIGEIWYDEYRSPAEKKDSDWRNCQKCAQIKIGGETVGFAGEISPNVLAGFKMSGKMVFFDLFFDKLFRLTSEEREYRPISKYPAAVRDISALVPRSVKTQEILDVIEKAGGDIVQDVDLFDIYEGEELPDGKKNFAFHIIYQSKEKTLSSKEIDEIQNRIIKTLEQKSEWEVRR